MKNYSVLLLLFLLLLSCKGQDKSMLVELPEAGFGCGFKDSKGVMWFGSRGNGVYKYDGRSFIHYTKEDGLTDNNISCIAEDGDGNLLFGTSNGICRFDRITFSHLAIPQSDTSSFWLDKVYPIVNPNQVMSILEDKNQVLWIGTNGAGVYRYHNNEFSQYLSQVGKVYEDSLQHNIVLSIIEDLSGNIWFTSLSHAGVSRFDGESFTHFKTEDGLSDNFVRTSYCDRAGNIWIGTHGNRKGGIDRYDGETFTNYWKTDDGFSHNNVLSIMEDRAGTLWMGSGVTNLTTFDGKRFKEFRSSEGHVYGRIFFVVEDAAHNIWFGGHEGLWKFDGKTVFSMIATD